MKSYSRPYRLFFPIGFFFSFWGAAVWLPFSTHHSSEFPSSLHALLMMAGFILSFANGFLMTAVPKFTQTREANYKEMIYAALPLLFVPISFFWTSIWGLYFLFILNLFVLSIFVFRRFYSTEGFPPESFLFIRFALLSGFLGLTFLFLSNLTFLPPTLYIFGKILFYQGFPSILILGIGGRLIPGILGMEMNIPFFKNRNWRREKILHFYTSIGIAFLLSIAIEAFIHFETGRLLRALLITWMVFIFWKIHTPPIIRSKLTWSLWISAWTFLLGSWGSLWTEYYVHFAHLFYIGGVGLMTLMISTRVTLAHGGYNNIEIEKKSHLYWWIVGMALLAALTRVTAGLIPVIYYSHLLYASITWILSILLWFWFIGIKIFKK